MVVQSAKRPFAPVHTSKQTHSCEQEQELISRGNQPACLVDPRLTLSFFIRPSKDKKQDNQTGENRNESRFPSFEVLHLLPRSLQTVKHTPMHQALHPCTHLQGFPRFRRKASRSIFHGRQADSLPLSHAHAAQNPMGMHTRKCTEATRESNKEIEEKKEQTERQCPPLPPSSEVVELVEHPRDGAEYSPHCFVAYMTGAGTRMGPGQFW